MKTQTGYEKRATWELKNMIKANSFLGALNTQKEDAELAKMKQELKQRKPNRRAVKRRNRLNWPVLG